MAKKLRGGSRFRCAKPRSRMGQGNGVVTPFPQKQRPIGVVRSSPLWFGVDYLRLNLGHAVRSNIIDSYFSGLSANSNERFGVDFMGEKFRFQMIEMADRKLGIFSHGYHSVMQVSKMMNAGALKNCSYRIDFYSAAFHIPQMQKVIVACLNLWGKYLYCKITRCDLAIDFVGSVQEFWDTHETNFVKTYKIGGKELETFYLGSKNKNKKHFIRVYNKTLDSQKKQKFQLYAKYLAMVDKVVRCEVQLNVNSCTGYNISYVDVLEYFEAVKKKRPLGCKLFQVLLGTCGNPDGTFLPRIARLRGREKRIRFLKAKKKEAKNIELAPYIKVFLGYARTLRAMGQSPESILRKNLPQKKKGASGGTGSRVEPDSKKST